MALTPTQRWTDTAAAGTADPVVLVELKPSVLYDDKRLSEDWQGGEDTRGISLRTSTVSGLNQVAPEDGEDLTPYHNQVRLGSAEVTHPEKQEVMENLHNTRGLTFLHSAVADYGAMPQFIQTFKSEKAFRLKKIYIGLPLQSKFMGHTILRLYSHLSEPKAYRFWTPRPGLGTPISSTKSGTLATKGLFDNARLVTTVTIEHDKEKTQTYDGNWRVLDVSDENIWLPGGDILCAIGLHVDSPGGKGRSADNLRLYGSSNGDTYTRGQLLEHEHSTGLSYKVNGDLAFKFLADGYESTGAGVWTFDIGESLSGYTISQKTSEVAKRLTEATGGTLEIADNTPPGTSILYQMRESSASSLLGPWSTVNDGKALGSKRYIQIKATLTGDSDQLDTPRIFSIRTAYQRSEKFATLPVLGYSNALWEAPDFSVSGDPLEGKAKTTDTSRIVLNTAEGMITRLFQLYPMKNDEVVVSLGFDTSDFTEDDYLPLKHLWVEGWTIKSSHIAIKCYDQQVKLKDIQIPGETDPPEKMEKIYYVKQTPDVILKDLLRRARVRYNNIDHISFDTTLRGNFNWEFSKEITEPTELNKLTSEINKHLLAFLAINEKGKWQIHSADFSASPSVEIEEADILEGTEETDLGIERLKNETVVLYNPAGGEAKQETDYQNITIEYDGTSQKANQEQIADKLLSTFIPPDTDSTDPDSSPRLIAHRRLALQKDGLRTTRWSTGIKYLYLQVGDHVSLNSQYYRRSGVSTYNPLTVMITSKELDADLGAVHWGGLIILDADQSAGSPSTVERAYHS